MLYFNNDYAEGCHQSILDALVKTNICLLYTSPSPRDS